MIFFYQQLKAELEQLNLWMSSHEDRVRDVHYGDSVEDTEELLRKHEHFEKMLAAYEDKFNAVKRKTLVFIYRFFFGPNISFLRSRTQFEQAREDSMRQQQVSAESAVSQQLDDIRRNERKRQEHERRKQQERRRTQEIKWRQKDHQIHDVSFDEYEQSTTTAYVFEISCRRRKYIN